QAYHLGRHVLGYEVQKVLAVVDWLGRRAGAQLKVGVAGYGEGGLGAFYAAALGPRIDACPVSGAFGARPGPWEAPVSRTRSGPRPWEEPIYRNVWGLQREFGDAEIATLIAPRGLVVEYSEAPAVAGPPPVRPGRRGGAAVGKLTTPAFASVRDEFRRLEALLP